MAKDEQFLLHDSGPETERILIFGTQRYLEMLELSWVWLLDGTFMRAPTLLTQMYVIHGLHDLFQYICKIDQSNSCCILSHFLPNYRDSTYRG